MPNKIATQQIIIAPLDFPNIENNNPMMANGITSQFNHPKNGINASNMPNNEKMPKRRPIVFMFVFFYFGEMVPFA